MIWDSCNGAQRIQQISGRVYRLAESQEQIATRRYVDSLQEQATLEEMLETSKPVYDEYPHLDYLLRTPFRYPPLEHGSRFGRPHEPSLFYGAESVNTTLVEVAYYRFLFFQAIAEHPKPQLCSEHTIFSVDYRTEQGIKLQNPPFNQYAQQLRDPADYRLTQQLGTDMRNAGVQGFQYESARDLSKGICIGLFSPEPFVDTRPIDQTSWFCEVDSSTVAFKQLHQLHVINFGIEQFQVNGILPKPAA